MKTKEEKLISEIARLKEKIAKTESIIRKISEYPINNLSDADHIQNIARNYIYQIDEEKRWSDGIIETVNRVMR
jgi:DNA-binding transcriptional regulator GbsR (MarR family)